MCQVRTHSEFVTLMEKVLRQLHHTFVPVREKKRKSSRDSNVVREPYSERERNLSDHREIRNFIELRADQAARGERVAQSRLPAAEYHTTLFFDGQKDHLLSDARPELDMRE